MNRAEKRRAERQAQKQEKTFTMKGSDVEKIRHDTLRQASRFAFEFTIGIPLLVLRDEFGFGKTRCARFYEAAAVLVDSIDKGLLTIDDIRQTIEKELDVKLIPGKVKI